MHPASAFHETDRARLETLVSGRGFALVIGAGPGGPVAAHAPVLMAHGRLRFHLSAANRLCGVLEARPHALAVVSGPDAYVSPDWYAAADQVPTWNYVAAEMEGPLAVLDEASTATLLHDLSAHFEAPLAPKTPWSPARMTPARFTAMLKGIVAYEMRVQRFEGVAKLSQNKPAAEIARVAAALAASPDDAARRIAGLMGWPGE